MLVLKRRSAECVTITHAGEQIEVFVLGHDGSGVRLGFDAPQSFVVVRSELVARSEEQRPAAQDAPGREASQDRCEGDRREGGGAKVRVPGAYPPGRAEAEGEGATLTFGNHCAQPRDTGRWATDG